MIHWACARRDMPLRPHIVRERMVRIVATGSALAVSGALLCLLRRGYAMISVQKRSQWKIKNNRFLSARS